MYAHPEKSGVRRGPEAAGNLKEEPRRLWGSGGLTNAKQEERTNRGGAEAGEGSGEQRGQDTGAMEDKEDEGASSSDNLHQTVGVGPIHGIEEGRKKQDKKYEN